LRLTSKNRTNLTVKSFFHCSFPALSRLASLAVVIAIVAGCRRQDVSVYDVPKETKGTAAASTSLPAGWEELPGDQMRVGNYVIKGKDGAKAQFTVIALPGTGGSELDNVNRWRGQLGLAPQTDEQMNNEAAPITIAGEPARMFEMSGTNRMLAAWQDHGGSRWFFKMVGDDALVKQQKPTFLQFCRDYRYSDAGSGAQVADSAPPKEQASAAANASDPQTQLSAPAEWKSEKPGPMQDAKFSAGDGKAVITVSIFEGTAGGILPNINRWRGQIGLSPVDEAGLSSLITNLDSAAQGAKLVDMNGSQQRMVAAIVPRGTKTAFFKLLGDSAAVGAEKDKFIAFVKSAK
jgi:hypothetical protein